MGLRASQSTGSFDLVRQLVHGAASASLLELLAEQSSSYEPLSVIQEYQVDGSRSSSLAARVRGSDMGVAQMGCLENTKKGTKACTRMRATPLDLQVKSLQTRRFASHNLFVVVCGLWS
jgi:hypothetical protein